MEKFKLTLFLFLLFRFAVPVTASEIINLKTEYTQTPIGIDVEKPRFSWQMQSSERAASQTAYQITVTDESGKRVWHTKKVKSDVSLNIKYDGLPLTPSTRYNWKVTVWNHKAKKLQAESWFETGLMNASQSAWKGAKWIGGSNEDMVLYSHYLPVFRIDYALQLDEISQSTRAGFVLGANDERLMNRNMNIYGLENSRDESYIQIELDISALELNQQAQLNIYRVGYHPNDKKDQALQSFNISTSLINNENKYNKHQFSIRNNFGFTQIQINNKEVARVNINPLGTGGDFIAFPVVADIGYAVSANQTARFSDIQIRNYRKPSNVLVGESGQTLSGGQTGAFVTHNPSRNSMPMLRTTFDTGKKIVKASLYVTSRGIYEFYLNGKRVSDDYFNPGFTQYNKTLMYQTFDVTDCIQLGKNAMGAILAEGWWSGGSTYTGENWNFFGDRQSIMAKLVIKYADNKEEVIVTNPETWTYFNDGPIVYGSLFQGEIYDSSKEKAIEGWSTASYQSDKWKQAQEIPLQGTIFGEETDYAHQQIIGQYGPAVKQIKELTAQSVEEVRPGVFVYDMGQNMVGVPQINLNGVQIGQKITLRFAEVKYPDMSEYRSNSGMIMLENIRAAMAQDIYITKGGCEVIQPRFTFHGYRYVEITGIDEALPIENVKGIVISSVHQLASSYETSNLKVNKLWENITWSTFGNFLSIPTDCPQRNERMGWSGDISVFSRAATYLADMPQFLRRHMLAMRNTQRSNGRFPDVAPLDMGFGGLLWGSAGITIPWESYQQYKDVDMLAEHYEAMKSYIHHILNEMIDKETNIIVQNRAWGDLTDWLGPEDQRNDKSLLWEAYFIYDLEIMQKVATILDRNEDAHWFSKLYTERKQFFNQTYIHPETGKTIFSAFDEQKKGDFVDTQSSYILALAFNIPDSSVKDKMVSRFVEALVRENKADNGKLCPPYSLMTGFIGTAWINKVLSDNGHSELAYRLIQQTTYPSWLYSVEQGATTIWERLNSYTHTDGFGGNNRMNSFNHYSFGAVASWMNNYSLGIERDENNPGFQHFLLKPEPDPTGQMMYAKGYYESMYGRIESSWQNDGNRYSYRFVVPANTTATLILSAPSTGSITENGKDLSKIKGVRYNGYEKGKHSFSIQSGSYEIKVRSFK